MTSTSIVAGRGFPYRGVCRATLSIGLLAFILPFASVSCGAEHVFTASGLNAIAGGQFSVGGPSQHYSGDVAFLLAALGALVALAAQLYRMRLPVRVVASGVASVGSLVMLLVGQAHANAELSSIPANMMVTIRWEVGFWLALAAMGASASVAALELYNARRLGASLTTFLSDGKAPRSLAVTASSLVTIGAGLLIIVACQLPNIHYTDQAVQTASPSIFNPGFAPSNWFAAEPVVVALLVIAAGIVLMRWTNRVPRAMAAAVILAYGAQTFFLFLGYVLFAVNSPAAQLGPGGVVGLIAGTLLILAGLAPALSLFERQPAPPISAVDV